MAKKKAKKKAASVGLTTGQRKVLAMFDKAIKACVCKPAKAKAAPSSAGYRLVGRRVDGIDEYCGLAPSAAAATALAKRKLKGDGKYIRIQLYRLMPNGDEVRGKTINS